MKKTRFASALVTATLLVLAGAVLFGSCKAKEPKAAALKVGMVTDAGTIDDKSFNQGTWEGVQKATAELKLESKYLKPTGTTEADYMKEIANLVDAGFKLIVCPGFKFETAIFVAQDKYPETKFVIIDGSPNNGMFDDTRQEKVGSNTVAIFFAEHESGFLAGLAAAVELKTGEFGYIGGMEIPAVQKFNWGFQQAIAYANQNLGTSISLKPENVIYQGTFSDVAAGQQLAAQMYDRGVKAIFCAAGGVGVGAINEAKARADKGVWIIGVDTDQYAQGIYAEGKSIILTSAVKLIDVAAADMVKAANDGTFPGGQTLTFTVHNNGVGIPAVNPNLSPATLDTVNEVLAKLKSGEIVVSAEKGNLIR
ncbi:MAG: BMP family ABC transporter substrate-binding protein [Treponema sp.]|jgi:basic membrane protein A|nr:MAG: BMP family ABC transporter substrate-binding protein [Treponema sp.]HQL31997.1 BMP family ABC transporter substrate-binding protein [Treponemataceae bacterium]